MTAKQATILASEVRMLKSAQTGRKYRIKISLPYAYSRPEVKDWPFANPPAKWPVVYLLDANWYFGMVTDMIRAMAWCERTTDAIVVGIGFPEDRDPQEALREAVARRATDYTDRGMQQVKERCFITRYRLEKRDPNAAMSEPVKPIVYYLDPATPAKWRPYVRAGIVAWSRVFERAGSSGRAPNRSPPASHSVSGPARVVRRRQRPGA